MSLHETDQIRKAAALLIVDLANPPTQADLCEEVGLSEYRLRKGFREVFEASIGAYLRKKRMERAAEILRSEDWGISAIADEVGFLNASRFAEAFRNEFGVNPSDYREGNTNG